MKELTIRKEQPGDEKKIHALVEEAFATAERSDGNEQDLVDALRRSEAWISELSLVAVADGQLTGHVLFTRAEVSGETVLALAPLSVLPAFQRQGIGTALVREGHRIAGNLGYSWSVVLGSGEYYGRFGYLPARAFGILPPFDVPDRNFMALKLREDAPKIAGVLHYAKAFGIETPEEERKISGSRIKSGKIRDARESLADLRETYGIPVREK